MADKDEGDGCLHEEIGLYRQVAAALSRLRACLLPNHPLRVALFSQNPAVHQLFSERCVSCPDFELVDDDDADPDVVVAEDKSGLIRLAAVRADMHDGTNCRTYSQEIERVRSMAGEVFAETHSRFKFGVKR